ncbi:unnamed protein product [Musa acuminata subsp. malaccensis]|uniref:(wild Malaysian banana) hypothetical protein n=1 Tax=Musa acuminata subsp. malaccensis TaxID=214687 RepID=A0A804IHM0_MUSAM|nr:unnamed protein product [Musa acuminata subsp. malaccensis]
MQSCLWTIYAAVFERTRLSSPLTLTRLLAHFMQGLENKIPSLW